MRTTTTLAAALVTCATAAAQPVPRPPAAAAGEPTARNVIFFLGDGMGVSTVTATRIFAKGVDGQLVMDTLPHTALSRTATADAITADSAGTISAMMSGVNTNNGVLGFGPGCERGDFNGDGDGEPVTYITELAKEAHMRVGIVTTATVTHATPAGCYAHINERGHEREIALQALPTDATYNTRLGDGLDLIMGGGRRFFVPAGVPDEDGGAGARTDGRDLRIEFQDAGYTYTWNARGMRALTPADLPVLALFSRSHMSYEYDRAGGDSSEPGLVEMTVKAIDLLEAGSAGAAPPDGPARPGYFLLVEGGRIDHAHHAGNAWRALTEAEQFDRAIGAAIEAVDLSETLIIVTADHSHVFNIAGYPLRKASELPYAVADAPPEYVSSPHNNIFDIVYSLTGAGRIQPATDAQGVPYTALGYLNGPGAREGERIDPRQDTARGYGAEPQGPNHPRYRQEAAIPTGSETHGAEDVPVYATGAGADRIRGTVKNTYLFEVMKDALGL